MLLGAVTKWPNVGENCPYDLAQVKLAVRRVSEDWHSIKVFSEADVSLRAMLAVSRSDRVIAS